MYAAVKQGIKRHWYWVCHGILMAVSAGLWVVLVGCSTPVGVVKACVRPEGPVGQVVEVSVQGGQGEWRGVVPAVGCE